MDEDRDLRQYKKESNKKEKELSLGKIKELTMMTCITNLRVMKPEDQSKPKMKTKIQIQMIQTRKTLTSLIISLIRNPTTILSKTTATKLKSVRKLTLLKF